VFYETNDRSIQFAAWGGESGVVFYKRTDPAYLHDARSVIDGRQIFAQLRLAKPTLRRSFFYPFIIIYAVILALALSIAFLIAERLSDPIRRLALGANTVAEGDWSYRLDVRSGGEIGRLVEAFNSMVSRLDAQRRRLVDMERMATWRELARHLAHEIKNPLLPIRLSVQELRDQYKGDDPKYRESVRESVRVIDDELDHLQNLVKEFSSFARMPDLVPRVESIESLVNDVAKLYPRIPIRIETDPALGSFTFDPDQMRRVIVNLLDNAMSALSEVKRPEVRIGLRRDGGDAVIEIADNGPGIPEENLTRVFEPYFTTGKEGSGLGLAIVKNIVLLHGGTVEARSGPAGAGGNETGGTLPGGATFVIRLPLAGPARR
jgi:nitrogen fixation/metabolism regulation signal transduction histidine kinase